MRKILASILTIGIVATLLGVGTIAYFSDIESANFTISAGVIDLEVNGENPWCEKFNIELKPKWNWEQNFTLHMTADSNPAKACFRITDLQNNNGNESEPELWAEGATYNCTTHEWNKTNWHPVCNLSDNIRVDISFNSSCTDKKVWYIYENGNYKWVAKDPNWDWKQHIDQLPTLTDLNTIGWIRLTKECAQCGLPEKLLPCHNYTFHISFHNTLNNNDNEYQGDTTTFTIEFYVTQTDY